MIYPAIAGVVSYEGILYPIVLLGQPTWQWKLITKFARCSSIFHLKIVIFLGDFPSPCWRLGQEKCCCKHICRNNYSSCTWHVKAIYRLLDTRPYPISGEYSLAGLLIFNFGGSRTIMFFWIGSTPIKLLVSLPVQGDKIHIFVEISW
jgi:hypothetical protein